MTENLQDLYRSFLDLSCINEGIVFLGNISTGKSTLIHLILRNFDNIQNEGFQQKQDGKFVLEGVINPKVTQPCTVLPKKSFSQKFNAFLVQMPAKLVQSKKRPNLDRLINTMGMLNSIKKIKFVLLVDAKHTAGNVQNWKKIFRALTDKIPSNVISQQLCQSVLLVVCKGKNDIDESTVINRLQYLQKAFNEDAQSVRKEGEIRLIESIRKKSLVRVFSKADKKTPQVTEKEIKSIGEALINMHFVELSPQVLMRENVQLNHEQQENLQQFNSPLRKISSLLGNILQKNLQSQNAKETIQSLEKDIADVLKGFPQSYSQAVTKQFKLKKQLYQKKIFSFNLIVREYLSIQNFLQNNGSKHSLYDSQKDVGNESSIPSQNQTSEKTNQALDKFFQILALCQLWNFKQLEQLGKALTQYSIFYEWLSPFIKNINDAQLLSQTIGFIFENSFKQKLGSRLLDQGYVSNQSRQFYQILLDNIHNIYPSRQQLTQSETTKIEAIELLCQLQCIQIQQVNGNLPQFWYKYKSFLIKNSFQKNQLKQKVIQFLANALANLGQAKLATQLFINIHFYYSAKETYKKYFSQVKSIKGQQKTLNDCVTVFKSLSLRQQGINFCLELRQRLRADRLVILKIMSDNLLEEKDTHTNLLEKQKILKSPQIPEQLLNRVETFIGTLQ